MPKYNKWVFTIFNYTDADVEHIAQLAEDPWCQGITCGKEIGKKSGRLHLQGCLFRPPGESYKVGKKELYEKLLPGQKKKFFCEGVRGSWDENKIYTQKDDNVIAFKDIEATVLAQYEQGTRNDIKKFSEAIKRKAPEDELLTDHLQVVAKYPRLENRLKEHYARQRSRQFRKVAGVAYFGKGGTGKSKAALYDDAGARLEDTYVVPSSENLKWWDGYNGESTIVINEMQGSKCKYERWKELMDGHQLPIETKGGTTYAEWTRVIMTSNKKPDEWWPNIPEARLDVAEFGRRIGTLRDFDKKETLYYHFPSEWKRQRD